MGNHEQDKLNLLFEMENIKTPLINYISNGVSLKIVTDLGYKDKNGHKKRFYEETRYPSTKYPNVDHLISSNFRINTYLILEYPNPDYPNASNLKNKGILIKGYSIPSLIKNMRMFDNIMMQSYKIINGKLTVLSDKAQSVIIRIGYTDTITLSCDIYKNEKYNTDYAGVRITLNDEYSFVVNADTTWAELYYRLSNCDLTTIGIQMIQSYMAILPGMATTDLGGSYSSTSRFKPYWGEDPDDIVNEPSSVSVKGKPTTKKAKINEFFNDL